MNSMPMALVICTVWICVTAYLVAKMFTPPRHRISDGNIDVRSTTAKDTLDTYEIVRKAFHNGQADELGPRQT